MKYLKRAQHAAEFAILLSVVIAAVAGMQVYVKRAGSAKIKKAADMAADAGRGTHIYAGQTSFNRYDTRLSGIRQYEPYSQYSQSDSYTERIDQEGTQDSIEVIGYQTTPVGGGHTVEMPILAPRKSHIKEIVSDVNVQAAGTISGELNVGSKGLDDHWDPFAGMTDYQIMIFIFENEGGSPHEVYERMRGAGYAGTYDDFYEMLIMWVSEGGGR